MCSEARGRVSTNVLVRDLDVAVPDALDGRRLEVVADGLPLFGGAQLAVDTTVSPLHADGSPHRHAADGAVLATARRGVERTNPELVGPENGARLVAPWKQEANGLMRRWLSCACWPEKFSFVFFCFLFISAGLEPEATTSNLLPSKAAAGRRSMSRTMTLVRTRAPASRQTLAAAPSNG